MLAVIRDQESTCPPRPTSSRARSTATRSSSSSATASPTSSRSSRPTISEGESFVDDLDADSLALIELVEALEEELGERTVGLPHRGRGPRGPEDGARRRRLRRRPALRRPIIALPVHGLDALAERLGLDVRRRRRSSRRALGAPLVVRRARRAPVERAARVPRRRRARAGRHRPRLPRLPATCPRASWPRSASAVVNAAALAEVADELDLGDAPAARQGRGRRRRPREAVDPRRRPRGGDRRRLPRRRAGRGAAASCCGLLGDRIAEAAAGPGGQDYKTRLQELVGPPLRAAARATTCATTGPTTPSASSPPCVVGGAAAGRGRGPLEEAGRAGRRARCALGGACVDAPSRRPRRDRPMPELPEVETLRRDLETRGRRASGSRRVEVAGAAVDPAPRPQEGSSSAPARGREDRRASTGGASTCCSRSTPATLLVIHLRHDRPAAAKAPPRTPARQAHPRRDHLHPGRPAAVRRPAHVRRDVRRRRRRRRRARSPELADLGLDPLDDADVVDDLRPALLAAQA